MTPDKIKQATALLKELASAHSAREFFQNYFVHSIGLDKQSFEGCNPSITLFPGMNGTDIAHQIGMPDSLRLILQQACFTWVNLRIEKVEIELRELGVEI